MNILALADIHMGAGAAYSDDRLADQVKVLEQIVQVAYDQDVRLCLIAGDVFHRPRPTPATLLAFRWFTDAMAALEIPTIACLGNAGHDQEGVDRPCALDLFESRWFRVSRRPELIWDFVDGVNVATLPSVPVSRLVSQSESVERAPIFDQAAEALLAIATELRRDAGNDSPCVLLGHWSVSGASLPNGLPVDSLAEPILDLASLERLNYDAMVFGHIHKPQAISETGHAYYCGSPMVVDFGEADTLHGVTTLDFRAGSVFGGFHKLEDRRFVTVDIDLIAEAEAGANLNAMVDAGRANETWRANGDENDSLRIAVNQAGDLTDAVVRVKYRATEEQARRIDTAALKRSLLDGGAHKVFQISAEIVKQDRARVQGVDENLEPTAALDAWIDANDVVDGEGLRELLARYTAAT